MKRECIRPKTPTTLDEARRVVTEFVSEYNHHRLHAAIGYVAPVNKLLGKEQIIFQDRKRKLNQARLKRAQVAFGAVKQVANL